jgi:hypothetical protein
MAFCADAVGILGVALGTAVIANAEVTGQVVGWAMRFLKSAYERDRAEDWQRSLFAVADRQLGKPLDLVMPSSVATVDVRIALLAKGLVEAGNGIQAREDTIRTLDMAVQEPLNDFSCERTALRLAALESVTRTAITVADENEGSISQSEIEVCAKAPRIVTPPVATQDEDRRGIGITNRPAVDVFGQISWHPPAREHQWGCCFSQCRGPPEPATRVSTNAPRPGSTTTQGQSQGEETREAEPEIRRDR